MLTALMDKGKLMITWQDFMEYHTFAMYIYVALCISQLNITKLNATILNKSQHYNIYHSQAN